MRRMGGLGRRLPLTYRTFLVATLALAGIPPLAGFFSKDAILTGVFAAHHTVLFGIGLLTAGLTAFYMFRLVSLTFAGDFRGTPEEAAHVHEAPPTMTLPLVILAFLSAVAGFLGLPDVFGENANRIAAFLAPIFPRIGLASDEPPGHALSPATEWFLIAASVAVAVIGILVAWNWYVKRKGEPASRVAASFPALYRLVAEKFRIDELYGVLFVKPLTWLARVLWKVVDVLIIDGVLNAGAFLVELVGDVLRFLQTGNVRNYALTFLIGIVALLLIVLAG
jgi:NADH-quinone oxidoreductase subunit L